MRISHSRKFVFLATPRTGSTTARNILDNYSDIKSIHITETSEDFPYYHHISASELKSIFADRSWNWDSYKKFCVVRNPYDRIVSLYHLDKKLRTQKNYNQSESPSTIKQKSFKDYVMTINPKQRLPTSLREFICDADGNFLVNDILMFEKLRDELPKFLDTLDISITSEEMPHLNASINRQQYQEYYDSELRQRVYDLYQYEIERFGYVF